MKGVNKQTAYDRHEIQAGSTFHDKNTEIKS
jgi:hypothetical protein